MKHQLKKFRHEIAILNFNERFKESFYSNLKMRHLPTILQEGLCFMNIICLFFHYNICYNLSKLVIHRAYHFKNKHVSYDKDALQKLRTHNVTKEKYKISKLRKSFHNY